MKHFVALMLAGMLLFGLSSAAGKDQIYFKFNVETKKEIDQLSKLISIDEATRGNDVYAYATEEQFETFKTLGYRYEILPDPGSLIVPEMADSRDGMRAWDSYPTYDAYVSMMQQYATNNPTRCLLDTIGTTVQGRLLLAVKISDNVALQENEPEFFFTSSMHGDETTGYVLMLRLIDSLLTGYGISSKVTNLVDNIEIWINPLGNPDGTYRTGNSSVSGAIRYNANLVDLNRNYPDPQDGQHPDGNSWQPETIAMMDFANTHSITMSVNFHGGAEVVNYPWDTWSQRHADDAWCIATSREYADSCHANSPPGYLNDLNNGITNGWDWYEIDGGRQDYMTYFKGGREVTIEISSTKLLPAGSLPAWWTYNRAAFLEYAENVLFGVRGIVTDAISGLPLAATVTVLNHDVDSARVFTDPDVGDYHRMIAAGTWDLKFTSPGCTPQTITGVQVLSGAATILHVQMQLLSGDPDLVFLSQDAGYTDAGDTAAFRVTLENDGAVSATSVSAVLSSADAYVTVTSPSSTYPNLAPEGGTGVSNSQYKFAVSPSCPQQHIASFRLDIAASGGYVDSAFFDLTIVPYKEDFESGNFASWPWQMSGDADWMTSSSSPYEGLYVALSGDIGDLDTTSVFMTLDVDQPGTISFHYKVSSEATFDFLRFYIDGIQKGAWSGNVSTWTLAGYPVDAGTRTFKWSYTKDVSISSGSDATWVDMIVLPHLNYAVPLQITTGSLPYGITGHSYSIQLEATGGSGQLTWSDFDGGLNGSGLSLSSSGLLSGTPTVGDTLNFTARVQDQSSGSDLQLYSFVVHLCGDINGSFVVNVADVVALLSYIFNGGQPPVPLEKGDANCAPPVNIADVVYLIGYIFNSGPVPCDGC